MKKYTILALIGLCTYTKNSTCSEYSKTKQTRNGIIQTVKENNKTRLISEVTYKGPRYTIKYNTEKNRYGLYDRLSKNRYTQGNEEKMIIKNYLLHRNIFHGTNAFDHA